MDLYKYDVDRDYDEVGPLGDDDTRDLTCAMVRYSATGSTALVIPPSGTPAPLPMDHQDTCHPWVISTSPWKLLPTKAGYLEVHVMVRIRVPGVWTSTVVRVGVYISNVLHILQLDSDDVRSTDTEVTLQGSMYPYVNGTTDFLDIRISQALGTAQTLPIGTWEAYVQVAWKAHTWCGGCGEV